jgi:hypothetical protein|tara:strand:+ start:650 stop:1579 length:930 start_codon:yes stop_codon:yes gene_type:complete
MKNVTFLARLLISALFLLSAIAKLYKPAIVGILNFEESQLIPMGFSSDIAPFFSRLIIGFEFFIAFAILQSNYIKKLVIPSTILLITIFSIDLSLDIFVGNDENCGCFGELIPMTPIQALIKNIITLFVLFYLYKNVKDKKKSNFLLLLNGFLITALLMFALVPISNNFKNTNNDFLSHVTSDEFNNIIDDKRILCFFDAGCDHCQDAAKGLDSISYLLNNFPMIHIVFSDSEQDNIPNFFDFVGREFSYQIIPYDKWDTEEIDSYSEITFPLYDNPVVILYDGYKQVRLFDGDGANKFKADELRRILE